MDLSKQLDLTNLLEMVGGDEEFVTDVLATYLDSTPRLILDIQQSYTEGNVAALGHAAHTLKGSSRSIGAEPFAQLCQNIEQAARHEDFAGCAESVERLPAAYDALCLEIYPALQPRAA